MANVAIKRAACVVKPALICIRKHGIKLMLGMLQTWWQSPRLAWHLLFGPAVPAQYRLTDPEEKVRKAAIQFVQRLEPMTMEQNKNAYVKSRL